MSTRMAARRLSSPTANLLRKSRLFSLPPPIPPPFEGDGAFQSTVGSDTATQAFPTHQAIATPTSSLHRGDWGLKRPLPMRETTRSSAPAMRVFEVDTINFITDFESAGDHVRTLEKWQEMNMPISLPGRKIGASQTPAFVSAFTENEDNTYLDENMREEGQRKWRFKGPSVGEMTSGDFEKFLNTKVKGAKRTFGLFLKEKIEESTLHERREAARNQGTDPPLYADIELSPEAFQARIKRLREDTGLSSPLSRWIMEYFDMPQLRAEPKPYKMDNQELLLESEMKISKPRTHPSAGLSYLRTRNFMDNHPILGPRDEHAPIEARLLSSTTETNKNAKIGVAGIVSNLHRHQNADSRTSNKYNFDGKGGHKLWVTPTHASVDSNGRINLETNLENEYKVASRKGETFIEPELETSLWKTAERAAPLPPTSMPSFQQMSSYKGGSQNTEDLMNVIGPRSS
ncbi:mitochondrial ribosomal protein MRP51 [Phyllosticta capitalensis]